jgi:hypothetical protein
MLATLAMAGCRGGGPTGNAPLAQLPDLSAVRPFVMEKDGESQILADVSPAWSQLEGLSSAQARRQWLTAAALVLVKRDAVPKFPQSDSFRVKLVRVVEYDNYNRPLLATAKELASGRIATADLPGDLSLPAVVRSAASVRGLSFVPGYSE